MVELFKFLVISFICWLFFKAIKQSFFKDMVIFTIAVVLLGSGYLWFIDMEKKVGEKTENFNKKIDGIKESVDNFNESVDKVGKPVRDTKKKYDDTGKYINRLDDRIENGYENLKDRVLGR